MLSEAATGFHIVLSGAGGARSANPEKYRRDAQVLELALRTERDPDLRARYTFYLAQTYRGCGEDKKALEAYLARSKMGFWDQEVYWSLYMAAHYQQAFGRPVDEVLSTCAKASSICSSRSEALHDASRLCRLNNRFEEGYELAQRGLAISQPAMALFTVPWIYEYGLLDEFAVNAYWTERYEDCLNACQRLLSEGKMPPEMHDRVRKNADFARDKLASRVQTTPSRIASTPEVNESEPKRARLKVILICGPWGSGTSVVAGLLDRMGAFGVGPYFGTDDPKTANSYESIPFREIIRNGIGYRSQLNPSFTPPVPGALQAGLRNLQTRIEQQEFGPYNLRSPKPIFLKYPLSAFVIPEICEVFDTKLIFVNRGLEDIERTRLRRNWEPYYGAEGAALIYEQMKAALKHHLYPTMNIDYRELLACPIEHAGHIARFAGIDASPAELRDAVSIVRNRVRSRRVRPPHTSCHLRAFFLRAKRPMILCERARRTVQRRERFRTFELSPNLGSVRRAPP